MAAVLGFVHETSPADFRRVTEVTYLGYVNGTLAAPERTRARDRGVIVMVGSALAYRAIPLQASYCAATPQRRRSFSPRSPPTPSSTPAITPGASSSSAARQS